MRKLLLILLLLSASPAWAQTATWIDSGGDSTTDTSMYSSVGTAQSIDATIFHTGPNALKAGSGAAAGQFNRTNVLADAGRRCTFWIYLPDATPATNTFFALFEDSAGATNVLRLRLNTTGVLDVLSTASLGTGATVLSDNTWTRINFSYVISGTANVRLRINGTDEVSLTGATLANTGTNRLSLRTNITTTVVYFDDIYCDDGTDLGDPGDIRVTAKRPISSGTAVEYTGEIGMCPCGGIGTGHAPDVSERPIDTGHGWNIDNTGGGIVKTEEYNVQTASAGDVDITGKTVKGVLGWVHAGSTANANSSIMLQGSSSGTISTTNANATYFKIGSATYPAGTGTDVGIVSDTTATIFRIYEAGVVIGYLNAAAASGCKALLLGVC